MKKKIGLSLSGGGYRAAAFHLGTLKKLNELNILSKIDIFSTISGGSITGAYYCLNSTSSFKEIEEYLFKTLNTKSVIKNVLTSWIFFRTILFLSFFIILSIYVLFTQYYWSSTVIIVLMIVLLIKYQFKLFPVSTQIEKAYDKFFFKGKKLQDLPNFPEIAIGSTNLQTCRHFTFSKRKMEDSSYAYMNPPIKFTNINFPIARAVMASSCVPFAFTPVKIDTEFFINSNDKQRANPQLVDGGVYDNQGIHKITQKGSSYECQIIITSDAGDKLPFEGSYNNVLVLLIRTMDVFMGRIKNFQMMQNLYNNRGNGNKEISYLSLGWDLENCIPGFVENIKNGNVNEDVVSIHNLPAEWLNDIDKYQNEIIKRLEKNCDYQNIQNLSSDELKLARSVGTNLTKLTTGKINALMKHASNLTELQIKLYCPSLLNS